MEPRYYTWPSREVLRDLSRQASSYMTPTQKNPYAIVAEGFLDDSGCDLITRECMRVHPYRFKHCNATTRELPLPLTQPFQPVENLVRALNELYWGFDLWDDAAAWHQSYELGNDYQLHMDGAAGHVRKLTAVVMLSNPQTYAGGELELTVPPAVHELPKTRGTVVVFQHWLLHRVYPLSYGSRQSLNVGFFGPEFK